MLSMWWILHLLVGGFWLSLLLPVQLLSGSVCPAVLLLLLSIAGSDSSKLRILAMAALIYSPLAFPLQRYSDFEKPQEQLAFGMTSVASILSPNL